ncbi:MAG: flagellar basal body rod protein FlgB [Deferrisomatales bacterium]
MGVLGSIDAAVAPLVRGLDSRTRRHAAISANIANADTPGYRAVDVSFAQVLERAGLPLATTHPRHLTGARSGGADRLVLSGGEARRDGNDVNLDGEMVKLARNQIEYQFLVRALGSRFRKLKEAITGRASQ